MCNDGRIVGQLYSELGYGEIRYSLANVGVKNCYWKARIDKAGTGATLQVFSGNTVNNSMWLEKVTA